MKPVKYVSLCLLIAIFQLSFQQYQNFDVYPNPSSGKVNIHFSEQVFSAQISIHSAIGTTIKQFRQEVNGENAYLDLSELPNGLYIIQIQSKDFRCTKRLKIQH